MPLVFSPISEDVLEPGPDRLFPKSAFMMRQLGSPPEIDRLMADAAQSIFTDADISVKDADSSVGGKDFLQRILGLIRGTGFTVALFSDETRPGAFANIALELGFAAMCGKPLVIIKSKGAKAPSDLARTDWIEFDQGDRQRFEEKLEQAIEEIKSLATFEQHKLEIALEADQMDCAVAFERTKKAFLLTGNEDCVTHAETILNRLDRVREKDNIGDLRRQRGEIKLFIRQARAALDVPN